jgi:CHASE2 domain-containing sensor protein
MKTVIAFVGIIACIYLAVLSNNLLFVMEEDMYAFLLEPQQVYLFRGTALGLLALALTGVWACIQIYRHISAKVLITISSVAVLSGLVIYFLPDWANVRTFIPTYILLAVSLLTLFEYNEPDADYF